MQEEEIQFGPEPEFFRLVTAVLPNMQAPAVESNKSTFPFISRQEVKCRNSWNKFLCDLLRTSPQRPSVKQETAFLAGIAAVLDDHLVLKILDTDWSEGQES